MQESPLIIDNPELFDDVDPVQFGHPQLRIEMASTGTKFTTIVFAVHDRSRIMLFCGKHDEPRLPDGIAEAVSEFNADPRAGWESVLRVAFETELELIAQSRADLDAETAAVHERSRRFLG